MQGRRPLPTGHGCGHAPTRLQIRKVLKQCIQNVRRFKGSTGDEAAKQRNVFVRNVAVSDTAIFAVTDDMLGKQIVFVCFKMGAVGGCRLACPPLLRQLKSGIQLDLIRGGST